MVKTRCSSQWAKCGLCGKKIDYNEECYKIQYKKKINSWEAIRYRKEYWHLKHFVMKDHSVKCKIKMECVTSGKPAIDLGCEKRLCIHYKDK